MNPPVALGPPAVAMQMRVELDLPCGALQELLGAEGDTAALALLGEMTAQAAKAQWQQELTNQQPAFWKPLKPATVAAKRQRGEPFPDQPLRGTGELERALQTMPAEVQIDRDTQGATVTIGFGPRPHEDMAPSEKLRDMFYGSPATIEEAARYTDRKGRKRGVTPARPLAWDQPTRAAVEGVMQQWLKDKRLANDCVYDALQAGLAVDVADPSNSAERAKLPLPANALVSQEGAP